MREFFRGWKRKFGVVTLLMACTLSGLWMRSRIVGDFISFPTKPYPFVIITSRSGVFECAWYDEKIGLKANIQWTASPIRPGQSKPDPNRKLFYWWGTPDINTGGRVLHYGTSLAAPYLTMVIPFTLVSAWLLLRRPKSAAPSGK